MTDEQGLIYLPEIGWLKTHLQNEMVTIGRDVTVNGLSVSIHDNKVPFAFEPLLKISDTPFELVNHQHPLLAPHYFDSKNKLVAVEIVNITKLQKGNLTKAFALIRNFVPEFYNLLEQAIQKVVIFNDPSVKRNSFATVSVHGCSFFNSFQQEYDEIFFLEEIIHQCSHNTFNCILFGNDSDFFKIDIQKAILGDFIGNDAENRTIHSALHGLYTVAKRYEAFEILSNKNIFTDKHQHEFLGRLGDLRKRFRTGLEQLNRNDIFTNSGADIYQTLDDFCFQTIVKIDKSGINFDFSNQPSEFSYSKFLELNPLP